MSSHSAWAGATKREALEQEAAWRLEALGPPRPAKKSAAFSGFARHWFDVHVRTNLKPASPLLSDAVCWGYCEANPAAGVRHLAVPDVAQHWTREEADAFLEAVVPRWRALFATALMTGMRRGELAALEWSDLDLEGRRIEVRRNWSAGVLGAPKSGKPRAVPLPTRLVRELQQHPRRLGTDLVLPTDGGGRPRGNLRSRLLARGAADAQVPRIRFHDLRHTYASHLVMAGVPLKAVQEYLGHASITTTMR